MVAGRHVFQLNHGGSELLRVDMYMSTRSERPKNNAALIIHRIRGGGFRIQARRLPEPVRVPVARELDESAPEEPSVFSFSTYLFVPSVTAWILLYG